MISLSQMQKTLNRSDLALQHNKLVNDIVERFKKDNSIPPKLADGLITSNPRSSKFYISPKIHKENNAGRP